MTDPISLSKKIELIKSRSQLAKEIRDSGPSADLSALVKEYERSVRELKNTPTTSKPQPVDPWQVKELPDAGLDMDFSQLAAPHVDEDVDRSISPENLVSAANLYACYQFDQLGVFDVVAKIFRDFFEGRLRITTDKAALALYRYEKRNKDRYHSRHRRLIYNRNFGYGTVKLPSRTPANEDFHKSLITFVRAVSRFYRDQRISEVIKQGPKALRSSFGSVEQVRKAGIDLRNGVNRYSSGITLLFTIELSRYLDEVLMILREQEVQAAYNVSSEWALIEKIGEEQLGKREKASVRGSLGQEGRAMLEWLAGDEILEDDNLPFEITLNTVGQAAERWLISYKALGRP